MPNPSIQNLAINIICIIYLKIEIQNCCGVMVNSLRILPSQSLVIGTCLNTWQIKHGKD